MRIYHCEGISRSGPNCSTADLSPEQKTGKFHLASLNRCNTRIPVPASWLNSIWHEPSVPNDMFVTSDVSEVATLTYLTELHHVAYLSVIESKSGAHRSTSSPIPLHRFTVEKKQNDPNMFFLWFFGIWGPPTASNPYLLLF